MTDSSAPAADRRGVAEPLALSLTVGAMAAVMFATHRAGHWWGDDWALYLRQADGLVSGRPGRVLDQNEFAVTMSRGPAFSPPSYPWGFPLVLAPFVAIWGTDIDRLAVVPVLSACAFACAWYLLARRRLGAVTAMVGIVAITISPLLLGWTELIQSEWTFMAVATAALVALDRAVARGRLVGPAARWSTLVGLGLWIAAAFSVRREGMALVAALGAAQLAALVGTWRSQPRPLFDSRQVGVLALPHAVAGITVSMLQIALPSTVIPRYSGTSPLNMWEFRRDHVDHLLEIAGLKRPWEQDPTVFDSATIGWVAAGVFFAAAVTGLVWAFARRDDVHLAAYAVVAFVIGASFPVPVNRYLATVVPVLGLLGAAAVTRFGRSRSRPWIAALVTTTALAAIAAGNVANAQLRVDRAADFAAAGSVEWGPTHPAAVEMFDEVRSRTGPQDVVAAPKARAMTFATGLWAVQVDDRRPLPELDLALVVTQPGTAIHRSLLTDPAFERVWSNTRFSIFEPTG